MSLRCAITVPTISGSFSIISMIAELLLQTISHPQAGCVQDAGKLKAPKPAPNGIEQKPPSLFAVRSCTEHRKTPGSHEPGVFASLCGRNLPAAAGFYGVWALGLTPRRAGGRCPPRPRWSARSGRSGPSCPSGGSALPAAPSPCRGGAGR